MATPPSSYGPSSYGERPPLQGYRRSFTAPSRQLSLHEKAGLDRSDADADILYSHPNARIISFSPPTDAIQSLSKETLPNADYPIDAVEVLPWRSRTETLASSGPIKIEKVRGSSHFLKSADQKVIQGIMRNSQCWCVDGESKFVLRIGKLRYYRIELPSETDEDKQKVEEMKTALGKVLRFERTPCPFKRAFHVDLPDDAITPRRKGTWKRRQPLQPTTPNTDPLPLRRTKNRAWTFQAQNDLSPSQSYGRRGSDYGFSASRGSSRSRTEANEYRSSTPSSVVSSEDGYERTGDDGSSEDGLHGEDSAEQPADGSSIKNSEPEESAIALGSTSMSEQHKPDEKILAEDSGAPSSETLAKPEIESTAPSIPLQDKLETTVSEVDDSEQATENLEIEVDEEEIPSAVGQPGQETESLEEKPAEAPAVSIVEQSLEENNAPAVCESQPETQTREVPEPTVHGMDIESTDQLQEREQLQPEHDQPQPQELGTVDDAMPSLEQDDDALSRVSSVDSFHTTDSLPEDMSDEQVQAIDFEQSRETEGFTPFFLDRPQHSRGLSEMTITASTIASERSSEKERPSTSDSTPGLARSSMSDSSWPEVHTPPSSPIKDNLRRRLQAKRSLSPLPPSTILYSPTTSPTNTNYGSPFTAHFLQKAANVALIKPIEAVALLAHILARIAGGATLNDLFSGDLFRRPSDREQGPRRRRTSFPDQPAEPRDDSEDSEDDFGVPIRGRTKSVESTSTKARTTGREREDDQDSIFDLD
ncbi:hypothetical protein H2200_004451 [Cladophialophora chaetospira]|uniref:Inheritance of peroxisomes protein 1 n=1 Tax=Cladophialophora chaetospira TaxID=386627 RepID=A0AA39CK72_9EURO|nr:hypothetical protein H2200_004451 [Cladophialophora chaetospira]